MPGIRNPSPIALDKGGGKGGGVAVIVPVLVGVIVPVEVREAVYV